MGIYLIHQHKVITEDVLKEIFSVRAKVVIVENNDDNGIIVYVPCGVYR